MRTRLAVLVFVAATLPVHAADLTGDDLRKLLTGKTIYLDLAAGGTFAQSGQSVLYYGADGTVLNRTPAGKVQHGTWVVKDNTMCVTWKEVPNNPCSRYDKQGDTITIINVATGQPRGKIAKIADGNAEGLKL